MERPPASIPADEFFGDRPAALGTFHYEDEDLATGFGVEAPLAPAKPELEGEQFFPRAAPPPDRPLARWAANPWKQGGVSLFIGFVGTLVLSANLLTQIVLGAPIFEELWKFGVALLLVALLRVENGSARVLVALVPGVGFGVFEHFLTYPDEPLWLLANRVTFHSGATALSMGVYHALAPLWDARVRWAATIPATIIHWLNNFGAVVLGVASVVAEEIGIVGLALTFAIAASAHVLAWLALAGQRRVRGLVLRLWVRHVPRDLQA